MRVRNSVLASLLCAVTLGLTFPYAELAWKCRSGAASSESCVWARAYFPLSRWVEPLIVTPATFVVLLIAFRMAKRTHR